MSGLRPFNATQSTQPPTQAPDNPIIDILVYMFVLVCSENVYCSGVFRMLFSLVMEAGSAILAWLPVRDLERRFEREGANTAKLAMGTAWIVSNVMGGLAIRDLYNRQITNPEDVSFADKFDAATDAAFGGTVVAAAASGTFALSYACLQPPMARMYKRITDSCGATSANNDGYSRLRDGDQAPRCCL